MMSGEDVFDSHDNVVRSIVGDDYLRPLGGLVLNENEPAIYGDGYAVFDAIQYEHPEIEAREEQVECLDAIQEARVNG